MPGKQIGKEVETRYDFDSNFEKDRKKCELPTGISIFHKTLIKNQQKMKILRGVEKEAILKI